MTDIARNDEPTPVEDEDVQGHRVFVDGTEDSDDVQGHRLTVDGNDEDDDVQGHRTI